MNHLYMFAIMPPSELASGIESERIEFSKKYNCVKALKPPVHITLFPPFKTPEIISTLFVNELENWAEKQFVFSIALKNFSFFSNRENPVVFIDVVQNKELNIFEKKFRIELNNFFTVKISSSYKPHFTIAYRDLSIESFQKAKEEYSLKKFTASFEFNSFFLWKHNGENWEIINEFKLNKNIIKNQLPIFF